MRKRFLPTSVKQLSEALTENTKLNRCSLTLSTKVITTGYGKKNTRIFHYTLRLDHLNYENVILCYKVSGLESGHLNFAHQKANIHYDSK